MNNDLEKEIIDVLVDTRRFLDKSSIAIFRNNLRCAWMRKDLLDRIDIILKEWNREKCE
jgi:hypothetical protein